MNIFNEQEQERIRETVAAAERSTSGEIRICVERTCKGPAMERAISYFNKLGMAKTKLRNGVLIYLSTEDHHFAIIGDMGIDKVVPPNFWDSTKEAMLTHFRKDELVAGLEKGIHLAGEQLKKYFPNLSDDVDELSNDIAYGEEN